LTTEANAELNALVEDVERTGAAVTITNYGRPVAVLMPAHQGQGEFVQLPALAVADT
jgi:prevent-host-death family protein